ncbi:hypothetical protein OSTOST_14664, partial [Ostertagia ostertagi]
VRVWCTPKKSRLAVCCIFVSAVLYNFARFFEYRLIHTPDGAIYERWLRDTANYRGLLHRILYNTLRCDAFSRPVHDHGRIKRLCDKDDICNIMHLHKCCVLCRRSRLQHLYCDVTNSFDASKQQHRRSATGRQ